MFENRMEDRCGFKIREHITPPACLSVLGSVGMASVQGPALRAAENDKLLLTTDDPEPSRAQDIFV